MKKVLSILKRDFKVASKDPIAIWIALAPILLAVIIVLVSPGISDTTLNLAVHKSVDSKRTQALEKYAKVTVYESEDEIKERVSRRDEVIGVTSTKDGVKFIAEGNESENGLKTAKLINSLYESNALENSASRLSFYNFGQKIPALKLSLAVSLLLIVSVVSSMITALGLVDEKADKTIKAANVTPMKQTSYILSKSILGIVSLLVTSIITLFILGMWQINWIQMILMIFASSIISMIVAFTIGLKSTDFIEAASSIKILMIPLLASVLVYELVSDKWQWTVWWSPFYWSYKGFSEIINSTATWSSIFIDIAIVLFICFILFKLLTKNIRKELN